MFVLIIEGGEDTEVAEEAETVMTEIKVSRLVHHIVKFTFIT